MKLFLFTVAVISVQAQTVTTQVGPMSCGLRLYSPGQIQTYCFYLKVGSPPQTICNSLDVVTPANSGPTVAAVKSCFGTVVDKTVSPITGTLNAITWMAWLPFDNTGLITYQIATLTQPCTVGNGICAPTANGTENMQQGTIPSGVPLAWLPVTRWYANESSLSATGFGQYIYGNQICTVTSDKSGAAQFSLTPFGTLGVAWLDSDWCQSQNTSTPQLSGSCSQVNLTLSADPFCSAIPAIPVKFLSQAVMF